jgi:hypothetical protein
MSAVDLTEPIVGVGRRLTSGDIPRALGADDPHRALGADRSDGTLLGTLSFRDECSEASAETSPLLRHCLSCVRARVAAETALGQPRVVLVVAVDPM